MGAVEISLLVLSISGLITQIFIGLVLLRLIREMERWQRLPIMLPEPLPIITTLPAIGLRGGAVQFDLDGAGRYTAEFGSGGPFANEAGIQMLATFQRVER